MKLRPTFQGFISCFLLGLNALLLAACGGGDAAPAATADAAPAATADAAPSAHIMAALAADPAPACRELKNLSIAKEQIDVRESGAATAITDQTDGAVITDAVYHPSTESPLKVGYCEVRGEIRPKSGAKNNDGSTPSNIRFAVGLPNPSAWTAGGKVAVHFGGSGFDGIDFDVSKNEQLASGSDYAPLKLGHVSYGDDAGHQSPQLDNGDKVTDGKFALHDDEAIKNFGRMSLKKTREVAHILMRARYGSGPSYAYFLGTSTGGRDALAYLQRWPDDYQGAFVNQPALNYTATRLSNVAIGRRLYGSDRSKPSAAWINKDQTIAIQRMVLAECDLLDGAEDDLISNVKGCADHHDAIVAKIRASVGLSDEQLATLEFIQNDSKLGYALANGQNTLYGYNLFQGSMFFSVQKQDALTVPDRWFGAQAMPSTPTSYGLNKDSDASLVYPGDQWARYFVWRAAGRDFMTTATKDNLFMPTLDNANTLKRVVELSELTDASNANLNRFFSNGGKLILMHGLADEVISTRSTIAYFSRVGASFAPSAACVALHDCLRFYTVPGMGHGKGRYKPSWHALGVLSKWVAQGQAPSGADLVIDDKGGGDEWTPKLASKGTRPLCEHPQYPHLKPGADISLASNYSCRNP